MFQPGAIPFSPCFTFWSEPGLISDKLRNVGEFLIFPPYIANIKTIEAVKERWTPHLPPAPAGTGTELDIANVATEGLDDIFMDEGLSANFEYDGLEDDFLDLMGEEFLSWLSAEKQTQ